MTNEKGQIVRFVDFSPRSIWAFLKSIGLLGCFIGLFSMLAIFFYVGGKKLYFIASIFYVLSIIIRIADTSTDAFYVESIATFSLLLLIISTLKFAIFFMLTALWLTRFISPMGDVEEYGDTVGMSISLSLALALCPLFIGYTGKNVLQLMVYYQLARFLIYAVVLRFLVPATFITDLFHIVTIGIPLTIVQSYFILVLIAPYTLSMVGTPGWVLGYLDFFVERP